MNAIMIAIAALMAAMPSGCTSKPSELPSAARYWVTMAPLNLGVGTLGYCVAVRPDVSDGVWWWSPGRSGCSTRSTGPAPFHPDGASVVPDPDDGRTDVRFRLGQISAPRSGGPEFVDIHLVLEGGYLSKPDSGERVRVEPRQELEVPEGAP